MKTEYQTIKVDLKNSVAVFTMNNPPVNQLSQHFVQELVEAFNEANGDEEVKPLF